MMLQIKFDCNRPAGLEDIHIWKCGRTHGRTDARTPARVLSYKLTLWAFGSGELKINDHALPLHKFYSEYRTEQMGHVKPNHLFS